MLTIELANPRGFCAGVDRAIAIVQAALDKFGAPIYVRHEVVHNRYVVSDLTDKGAIFVEHLSEVPSDSIVIFSAHGVSQAVRDEALERGFEVFDATCPLVTKVHMEVVRISKKDEECILIGHAGHPEVEGTMGQYHSNTGGIYLVEDQSDIDALQVKDPNKLHYVTQTTLSVDETKILIEALQVKYPNISGPKREDICYATQNRQDAVRELAERVDAMIVVGSPNSSNSNRLRELSEELGTPSYLIDDPAQIDPAWLSGIQKLAVTAGASAPEILVQQVINHIRSLTDNSEVVDQDGVEENITFALPKTLRA